jgi:DNA polymerase-1
LSGDTDVLQLVDGKTKVYLLKRGVKNTFLYDKSLVEERYLGLEPRQLIDFRALKGDPSDNIPGVAGIGEKTAISLLKDFGTVENLYSKLEKKNKNLKGVSPKTKELLLSQKEQAFLSRDLSEIQRNVLIEFNLEKCRWGKYELEKIIQTFKNLGFNSLINRLPGFKKDLPSGSPPVCGDKEEERKLRLW